MNNEENYVPRPPFGKGLRPYPLLLFYQPACNKFGADDFELVEQIVKKQVFEYTK